MFRGYDDYMRVFDAISTKINPHTSEHLHCHFSKIEWGASGEKKHLTFADTEFGPDFEPLIEAIVKNNLSPNIICESAGTQSIDAISMKKMYKTLM